MLFGASIRLFSTSSLLSLSRFLAWSTFGPFHPAFASASDCTPYDSSHYSGKEMAHLAKDEMKDNHAKKTWVETPSLLRSPELDRYEIQMGISRHKSRILRHCWQSHDHPNYSRIDVYG
jgi:hypothetical protein